MFIPLGYLRENLHISSKRDHPKSSFIFQAWIFQGLYLLFVFRGSTWSTFVTSQPGFLEPSFSSTHWSQDPFGRLLWPDDDEAQRQAKVFFNRAEKNRSNKRNISKENSTKHLGNASPWGFSKKKDASLFSPGEPHSVMPGGTCTAYARVAGVSWSKTVAGSFVEMDRWNRR